MTGPRVWVEAARPRTLVAGVVPVIVGTAASGRFSLWRFVGALTVALAIQTGVNFANDYFDAVKGVDAPERVGPRRLTAAGVVTPGAMRNAMLIAFGVAGGVGVALALAAGPELMIVGALSILAALGYSGGPRPYGSAGLGELFVFIFFGLVATVGSAYVQTARVTPLAVAAAVPVGFLATAILVVNNLRDIDTDRRAGKMTLAVRMGPGSTRILYSLLIVGSYLFLPVIAVTAGHLGPGLTLLSMPLAVPLIRGISHTRAGALIATLMSTARLLAVFGALLAAGLWLGPWI